MGSQRMWRCIAFTFSVPFLGSFAEAAVAGDPSPEDLVAAYEKLSKAYEHAAYRAEMRTVYDGPKQPPGASFQEVDCRVWRDSHRCKFLLSRTVQFSVKGAVTKRTESEEQLFPGKGFIIVQIRRDGGPLRNPVRARLGELTDREKSLLYQSPVSLLYGRLDQVPLAEILRQSKLSARKAELGGKPVWVLEATGNSGAHALWLDPATGFLPRRIEQRKKIEDSPVFPADDLHLPAARLTEEALIVEAVQIEAYGKTELLTGFTTRLTRHFDNGQSATWTSTTRVRDVKLNPDFAKDDPFKISTPVTDGTRVFVHDEPNIVYEWLNGKIVKKTDQGALGRLKLSRFLGGGWATGLVTAACLTAGALALTIGIRVYRLRRLA